VAVPDKKPIESLRRAVRYLMAVDRVEGKKKQHNLTKDQDDQLKERRRSEEGAIENAFRNVYAAVWLPRVGTSGALDLEKVEVGGRPLQATGVHERVMELLTSVGTKKVFDSLHPGKIIERLKLGESLHAGEPPRMGLRSGEIRDAFFEFLEPPRITSDEVLQKAVARGVAEGMFAYTRGTPSLGADGKYQVALAKVAIQRPMSEDEVDLDSGFLMMPEAAPVPPAAAAPTGGGEPSTGGVPGPSGGTTTMPPPGGATTGGTLPAGAGTGAAPKVRTSVRIAFPASRKEVFKSFEAIANLADKSEGGKVQISIVGRSPDGYDPNWLRNAVQEPLDEADIEGLQME
jgi:hypothetical protein